jgi:hypothetical protein
MVSVSRLVLLLGIAALLGAGCSTNTRSFSSAEGAAGAQAGATAGGRSDADQPAGGASGGRDTGSVGRDSGANEGGADVQDTGGRQSVGGAGPSSGGRASTGGSRPSGGGSAGAADRGDGDAGSGDVLSASGSDSGGAGPGITGGAGAGHTGGSATGGGSSAGGAGATGGAQQPGGSGQTGGNGQTGGTGGTVVSLTAIHIEPASPPSLPAGMTEDFKASCDYTDRTGEPCTTDVSWSSSDESVATIDDSGQATTKKAGTSRIGARLAGVDAAPVTLTVTDAELASIEISTSSSSVGVNSQRSFSAVCKRTDGTEFVCTPQVEWHSSDGSATIDGGAAVGLHRGVTVISATSGTVTTVTSNLVNLTVTEPSGCEGALSFADAELEARLRDIISKPSGDILYNDVEDLREFGLGGYATSVEGIHCLAELTSLELTCRLTAESDLSEISTLLQLQSLTISSTGITTVPDIRALGNLEHLDLHRNSIRYITGIFGLTQLQWLSLADNAMDDIDTLRSLTGLSYLDIAVNPSVTNIAPLVENTGIGSGDELWLSNLGIACSDPDLAALRNRGVVLYDGCG